MKKKTILFACLLAATILLLSVKPLLSPTLEKLTWKTHFNSKYNHQLMIPADWQVEEWDIEQAANLKNVPDGTILHQGQFFGKDGHFEILIWENKGRAPVRQWLTWFRHEDLNLKDLPQKENFSLANIPAIRYLQMETARKKPILYIFFDQDDKVYELLEERSDLLGKEASPSAYPQPIYDKILSSFQFVIK